MAFWLEMLAVEPLADRSEPLGIGGRLSRTVAHQRRHSGAIDDQVAQFLVDQSLLLADQDCSDEGQKPAGHHRPHAEVAYFPPGADGLVFSRRPQPAVRWPRERPGDELATGLEPGGTGHRPRVPLAGAELAVRRLLNFLPPLALEGAELSVAPDSRRPPRGDRSADRPKRTSHGASEPGLHATILRVPLPIDTRFALRTYQELVGLVEAVRDASVGEPETDSVEWKSFWDLRDAGMRFETARHALGFGNRTVFAAGQQFEGCAYILLGVEPGNLVGTPVIDPADIDNRLSKYISPGQPRWRPAYVKVDGEDVLVITVEGPRDGDPIFTLQQGYDKYAAGRVFVRRHGKTEEAGPADIRALEARGRADRPKVELGVVRADDGSPLRAMRYTADDRDRWLASERSRLLVPLEPPPPRAPPSTLDSLLGVGRMGSYGLNTFDRDTRSKDEYRNEVETYLKGADRRWFAVVVGRGVASGAGRVQLQIVNPTERNFEEVEVLIDLPDGQLAYVDADDASRALNAPIAPEIWGTRTLARSIVPRNLAQAALSGPRPMQDHIERQGEQRRMRYTARHVRPGETVALPPFHMTIRPEQGGELALRWRLTSTGVDGWSEGELLYEIAADAVEIEIVPSEESRRETLGAAMQRQASGEAPDETGS